MTVLAESFAAIVCDLDGVVYTGSLAVPHAVDALNAIDLPVVYATNNASRTPGQVAAHLRSLGVTVSDEGVLTSSLAAAHALADELPPGSPVLAIGGEGVSAALRAVGLDPYQPGGAPAVAAVLQGYGPQVTASDLGEAAAAIQGGARWIATNDDLTLPTERGPAPGNGALVAAVRAAVMIDPEVIGKPHAPMYTLAAAAAGATPRQTLAVGDRLETDIAGAHAAGMAGALVLTGVHGISDAAAAPPTHRPQYVLTDLRELTQPYPPRVVDGNWSRRGSARARCDDGLHVEGEGVDALRAALDALWAAVDVGVLTPEQARRLAATR